MAELSMRRYKLTAWVGPAWVDQMAQKFRDAGYKVTHTGTEHVYAIAETTEDRPGFVAIDVLIHMKDFHGTDFGMTVGATLLKE